MLTMISVQPKTREVLQQIHGGYPRELRAWNRDLKYASRTKKQDDIMQKEETKTTYFHALPVISTYTAVSATYEDGTNIIIFFSFSSLVVSRNIGPPDRLGKETLLPGKHSWQEKRTVYARNDELSPLIQVSRTYTITCIREDSMYC